MSDNGCNPSHNSRRDRNRPASTLTRSCRRSVQRRPTQTTEARWCPIFVAAPATGARPQIEPEPVIACTVSCPAKHSNFSWSPHAENRHIVCRCSWAIWPRSLYWVALSSRTRSEEHTSELQSLRHLVCRLLLEKKKK